MYRKHLLTVCISYSTEIKIDNTRIDNTRRSSSKAHEVYNSFVLLCMFYITCVCFNMCVFEWSMFLYRGRLVCQERLVTHRLA